MQPYYVSDGVTIYHGDCLDVMRKLPDNSIDTVLTDPPYGLEFMGEDWDHGVPGVVYWREVLRIAKPGALMLTFGGTRTHHRLMTAIEDAGWELRDVIMWVYGNGFPKGLDISKGVDKYFDAEREVIGKYKWPDGKNRNTENHRAGIWDNDTIPGESHRTLTVPATEQAQTWDGYKTALKPAWEPIIIAMKPLDSTFVNNALTWGVSGLNIDECRVVSASPPNSRNGQGYKTRGEIYGGGNGLPDYTDFTPSVKGRYPANLIHDGSEEVMELFPDTKAGNIKAGTYTENKKVNATYGASFGPRPEYSYNGDTGSAARYFYCAKASRSERDAGLEDMPLGNNMRVNAPRLNEDEKTAKKSRNTHPTVKPLKLMQYLARLTKTPTGGVVLDPFMGSGTTGVACILEGRQFIGIDMNAEYCEIAKRRIQYHKEHASQLALIT